jgi:hypothetical protein
MMKHLLIPAAAAALALSGFTSTPAAAAGKISTLKNSTLAVCHFAGNMRDDSEDRTGRVLVLPIRQAIASHVVNHGDAPLPAFLSPTEPFRTGEECSVKAPPPSFLTGEVTVGGKVVLQPMTSIQVRAMLVQLVNESDLSPAEKVFLLALIARAFSST